MSPYSKRTRAFTLIELLIVITIIGILVVGLLPQLVGGSGRARDARRKGDLQQISLALESYYADHGSYPAVGGTVTNCVSTLPIASSFSIGILSDPSGATAAQNSQLNATGCATGYTYIGLNSAAVPTGYLLSARLENYSDTGSNVYNKATWTINTANPANSATTNLGTGVLCSTTACTLAGGAVFIVAR